MNKRLERSADRPLRFLIAFLIVFVFALLAAGCTGFNTVAPTIAIDFYQNNRWRALVQISAPAVSSAEIENMDKSVGEIIQRAEANAVKYSFKREQVKTNLVYTLDFNGTDLSTLSDIVFEKQAVINRIDSNGRQQIYFAIAEWAGKSGISYLDLTVRAGEILEGNGAAVANTGDGWGKMHWDLYATNKLEVAVLPWSCASQAGTDLYINLLPDEYWEATMKLAAPGGSCTIDQVTQDMDPVIQYINQSGGMAAWVSDSATAEQMNLVVYGKGAEALTKGLLNGAGQLEYAAFDNQKISLSLPRHPKPGYLLNSLTLNGALVNGNGSSASTQSMVWNDFSQQVVANVESYSYFYLADSVLTIDFLTGQRWNALFETTAPLFFSDWEKQFRQAVNAYQAKLAQASLAATTACENVSNMLKCRIDVEGADFNALRQAIFLDTAHFTINEEKWVREISYWQDRELNLGFHSLTLHFRGGRVLGGNGAAGASQSNIASHPGRNDLWAENQVVTWVNPGRGAQAALTERFTWDWPALSDTAIRWGIKILPYWIIALVMLVFLTVYLVVRRSKNRVPGAKRGTAADSASIL